MDGQLLAATGLRKRFGDRIAVDGVGFTVRAGEVYGLLGPNGAGKTTTISMVCGLLERDAGDVVVDGRHMNGDAVAAKERIGYVPQDLALYPDLSARENLAFFGRLYGLGGRALAARVDAVLGLTGLLDRSRDRVSRFSGGMKRRLNMGIGLLHSPKLLVLDEPTVGVDPQTRNAIFEAIAGFRTAGMGIVYTTHYMEEAERLCDRIGIIDEGRLVAEGTRRELVASIGQRDRIEIAVGEGREALGALCRGLDGVDAVTVGERGITVLCRAGHALLPRIVELAGRAGTPVSSVEVIEPDLEAVFLRLTGKALRE